MLLLAGVGLVFALNTVSWRRTNDKGVTRTSRRPFLPSITPWVDSDPVSPAQLSALGYMPREANVLLGVHVADLLAGPLAKEVKSRSFQVAGREISLNQTEALLGIPASNIAYLVAGSVLERGGEASLTPPTVLVAVTRGPVGMVRLREALAAKAAREKGGRATSEARLAGLPVTLWTPAPTIVVLGLFTDLSDLPASPAEGLEHLMPEVRSAIEDRLAAGPAAWAVAHQRDPEKSPFLAALGQGKAPPVPGLRGARTAAAWVPNSKPPRVQAAVRYASEAAARQAEGELDKLRGPEWKVFQEKGWLNLQMRLGE
jgi:hypothetical protein